MAMAGRPTLLLVRARRVIGSFAFSAVSNMIDLPRAIDVLLTCHPMHLPGSTVPVMPTG